MRNRDLALALALVAGGSVAEAGINDPSCHPTSARPHPVVLAHGRSGHATDMAAITSALEADGYCVYGVDYGVYDGQTGLDHLTVSGDQLAAYVQQVLAMTGAEQVDAVGYSEGTGVIENFILGKGGAPLVHRVVSFGGLQHPYAHVSAAGFGDSDLYLPNLIVTARAVDPNITAQEVITTALDVYGGVGGQIAGVDRAVAESPFASDLFDPVYWTSLQGSLSEPDGTYIRVATNGHTLPTHDRAVGVCYTNIVSTSDPITGPSAGFQDPGDGIENVVLVSTADHGGIINDPVAIAKMVAGLAAPCASDAGSGDTDGSGNDDGGTGSDSDEGGHQHAGCSATDPGTWWPALTVLGLVARRRRQRRSGV